MKTSKVIQLPIIKKERRHEGINEKTKTKVSSINIKDVESIVLNISNRKYIIRYEPDDFISEFSIKICRYDDSAENDIQIGEAVAYLIRGDLVLEYGELLFDVMDAHSQMLCDLYGALFNENEEYIEQIEQSEVFGNNILFIDYIILNPEYRGYGLGKIILKGIIEELGGYADIVVIEPVPLCFEEEDKNAMLQLSKLNDTEQEQAKQNLSKYFGSMGFISILKNEDFMFIPMSHRMPTVTQLCEIKNKTPFGRI